MVLLSRLQDNHIVPCMIDSNNTTQIARLFELDKFLISTMGGLFSEQTQQEMSQVFDILDIACGAGSWALEVAQSYPETEIVGIDVSHSVISYARAHAQVRKLCNAHFLAMDILKPLNIPDQSFDLININPLIGTVPTTYCLPLLAECMRILRPGGLMCLSDGDWGSSNMLNFETLSGLNTLAMYKAGLSFSPSGRTASQPQMMAHLLRKAGFQQVTYKPYILDFSSGTPAHIYMCQSYSMLFKILEPFLLTMQVTTQKELNTLYDQVMIEMLSDDFCASWILLNASGRKPLST